MGTDEAPNRQVSVMEVRDGVIERGHDYPHIEKLTSNAAAWWLERIAHGWRETAGA